MFMKTGWQIDRVIGNFRNQLNLLQTGLAACKQRTETINDEHKKLADEAGGLRSKQRQAYRAREAINKILGIGASDETRQDRT